METARGDSGFPAQVMVSKSLSPRRSPPPLVSMEPRRDSLVGLQRLVYNAQVFSSQVNEKDKEPVTTTPNDDSNNQQDTVPTMTAQQELQNETAHLHQRMASPKPKRSRTSFTPAQLERLEDEFRNDMYVVGLKRMKLANELLLSERQVKVWFQNRRMKYKRERAKLRPSMESHK